MRPTHLLTSLAGALLAGPLLAGTDKAPAQAPSAAEPQIDLWEVTVWPYGWLTGIEGTSGVAGFTTVVGRADIGGFGVGSDLIWQLSGALGWHLTPRTTVELGYRHLYADYTSGGFVFDMSTAGAFLGMGFTF